MAIGIVAVFVAAEFLQKADLLHLIPANEGHAIKALDCAVRHVTPEGPLHHGLILFVEILPDVPALYRSPGVPLIKPKLDLPAAVILRSPALDVDGIRRKEVLNTCVLLVQPHGKPAANLRFPLLLYLHGSLLIHCSHVRFFHRLSDHRFQPLRFAPPHIA